jgi:hypothetical protein
MPDALKFKVVTTAESEKASGMAYNMIEYTPLPEMFGGAIQANYKGVVATIATGDDWVSIWSIESKNKRQGEATEIIKLLSKDYPDKKMFSSVPINVVWQNICDKHNISYSKN